MNVLEKFYALVAKSPPTEWEAEPPQFRAYLERCMLKQGLDYAESQALRDAHSIGLITWPLKGFTPPDVQRDVDALCALFPPRPHEEPCAYLDRASSWGHISFRERMFFHWAVLRRVAVVPSASR